MPPLWLIYSAIAAICVGITVAIVVVATRKGKSEDPTKTLSVSVINPLNQTKEKTIVVASSVLSKMNVESFIANVLNNFKEVFPEYRYIYWKAVKINNISIPIDDNGNITENIQGKNILSVISPSGSLPTVIPIFMQFNRACPLDEKSLLKCNPCKGEAPVCSSSGWICKPGQICATGSEKYDCCKDSPLGPYATCDENKNIVCGPCPNMESACSSMPPCSGFAPICTATGPVCIPNQVCPPKEKWSSCHSCPEGEFVTCINGTFSCEKCETPDGFSCPESCSMNGPKCDTSIGKMTCVPGVKFPTSDELLKSCCTDPNKPVPFDGGDGKVDCKTCDPKDKPKNDPNQGLCDNGSCQGHGWVCTKDGWVCKAGVVCPSPEIAATCCPSTNTKTSCSENTNFCVTCSCPDNTTSCGSPFCSSQNPSQCQKTCCESGIPCQKDPSTGECICCSSLDKVCHLEDSAIPVCCGPGLVCKDRHCVATCGPVTCAPGQECATIQNVTPQAKETLQNEYKDQVSFIQDTAYICMTPSSCAPGNETALPSSINNYYPCLPLPLDTSTGKAGYCLETVCSSLDNNNCEGINVNLGKEIKEDSLTNGIYYIKLFNSDNDRSIGYMNISPDGITVVRNTSTPYLFYIYKNPSVGIQIGFIPPGVTPSIDTIKDWAYIKLSPNDSSTGTLQRYFSNNYFFKTVSGVTKTFTSQYDPGKLLGIMPQSDASPIYGANNENSFPNFRKIYFKYFQSPFCKWDNDKQLCVNTQSSCSATTATECISDSSCTWKDIVKAMSSGDMSTQAEIIKNDLNKKYDTRSGNYCDPSIAGQIFSRVIGYNMGENCTWDQCWTQVAQPGVVDISFDNNTKNCVALQNCNGTANMNSSKAGRPIANNSAFPLCSTATCPFKPEKDKLYCIPNGKISDPRYYCKPIGNNVSQCQLDPTGNSLIFKSDCNTEANCFSCDPTLSQGTPGGCY